MSRGHFRQPLLRPERLIGIAENSGPAERAYFVDYFARMRSTEYQIAPVYNQVRCNLPQVCENRLQRPPVTVNVGDDRNSHETHSLPSPLGRLDRWESTSRQHSDQISCAALFARASRAFP